MRKITAGYSLIELLATVAMISILVTVGVPSFNTLINGNKQTRSINNFIASINQARSEAVKRSRQVVMCSSANDTSCDATKDWNDGWLVFIDEDRDNTKDANEQLINIESSIGDGYSFVGSANVEDMIVFSANGFVQRQGNLVICDPRGADKAKSIILGISGKAQISSTDQNGDALLCP